MLLASCAHAPASAPTVTIRELNAEPARYHMKTVTVRAYFLDAPPHSRFLYERVVDKQHPPDDLPNVRNADGTAAFVTDPACLNVIDPSVLRRSGRQNRWVTVRGTFVADYDPDGGNSFAVQPVLKKIEIVN